MIDLLLLAVPFKTGSFLQDIIVPAIAIGVIGIMILNQILKNWGYALW